MRKLNKSKSMHESASKVLPLGVTSNYRYWGADHTLYVKRGKGAHIWDVDDNKYIDFRLSYGPIILGYADERVDQAVINGIKDGVQFALSLPLEEKVASQIISMCPGIEMIRFSTSGCEATMHSLRLARAYTGREKFIMFEGAWHGLHDNVMFNTDIMSSRQNPTKIASSLGIPDTLKSLVTLLPFNDPEILESIVKKIGHEVAAIIVEPILGNCGGIMPLPQWLHFIRKICDNYGIVFIMDEVKTGFRIAKGGAQEYFGVKADIVCYAKSIANGYALAAFGGKKKIMELIGDGVMHGGTYNANKVGLLAANATLDILDTTNVLEKLYSTGKKLEAAFSGVLSRSGLEFVFSGHPSMFMFWFTEKAPTEMRDWKSSDHELYNKVAADMIERGILIEPSSREPWFLCASHTDEDIAIAAQHLEDSLKVLINKKTEYKAD